MLRNTVLLLFVIFASGKAAFVDTLSKCSIKDNQCLANLYTRGMSSVAKTGIPEYDIPPFDPYEIKNISVSILNMVDIGMVDGVAKNLKSCFFDSVELSMENLHVAIDVTCDVTIKGNYKVETTNPIVKNILGSTVTGNGIGRVKIEKFHLHHETDFFLREVNNDIFIDWKFEDMNYNYTMEKAMFAANDIKFGGLDVSNQIIGIMNENWEFLITTFGKPFVDTTIKIVNGYMHKFFDGTPTKYFFIEDIELTFDTKAALIVLLELIFLVLCVAELADHASAYTAIRNDAFAALFESSVNDAKAIN